MSKYSLPFLSLFCLIFIFLPAWSQAQDKLDIDIQLHTQQFSIQGWENSTLFTITIRNTTPDPIDYFIELKLTTNIVNDNPAVWAVSTQKTIVGSATQIYTNFDFTASGATAYEISPDLENIVTQYGYLPAGDYDILLTAYQGSPHGNYDSGNREVTGAVRIGGASSTINIVLASTFDLSWPDDRESINEEYPNFQWSSPGMPSGMNIEYHLRLAHLKPETDLSDAFSDPTAQIIDTEWTLYSDILTVEETGTNQIITFQLPSDLDRGLVCGFEYAWQVEAREVDENGDTGILWGWPDPVKSHIRRFTYGSRITADNLSSPVHDSEIETVTPEFSWTGVSCNTEFKIFLSENSDDPNVESPRWTSDPVQSQPFSLPRDSYYPLLPGKKYSWKVVNADDQIPISDIFTFTVKQVDVQEPAIGEIQETVLLRFNVEVPRNIAGFELRISDGDDPNVEQANIFQSEQTILNFPFQYRGDDPPLLPGNSYYWKLIVLDANDNFIGDPIADYPLIWNFSIKPIELTTPASGDEILNLTPMFQWDVPQGISQYRLLISPQDDQEFSQPVLNIDDVQNSPFTPAEDQYSTPLEYSQNYWWTVLPSYLSATEMPDDYPRQIFKTPQKTYEPAPELEANVIRDPLAINFQWGSVPGADCYHLILSESNDMGNDGLLSVRLWEQEDVVGISHTLTTNDYDLVYKPADSDEDKAYYAQIIAMKDDERHSVPSRIQSIRMPEEPGVSDKPTIDVEPSPADPRSLNITLTESVTGADQYIVSICSDQEMNNTVLGPVEILPTQFPYLWIETNEYLIWESSYWIGIQGQKNDRDHGQASIAIQIVIPARPLFTEKPVISIYSDQDQRRSPLIQFTTVPGAETYHIYLSGSSGTTDGKLTSILWENDGITTPVLRIPGDENDLLDYNTTYYIQVQGEKGGKPFTVISEVVEFITLPASSDEQVEFSYTFLPSDPRVVIFSLDKPVAGATEYRLETSPSGTGIWATIYLGSQFPVTIGPPTFSYNQTYGMRMTPFNENGIYGVHNEQIITIGEQPGASQRPEFSVQINGTTRQIMIILDNSVEQATDYRISISENQDLTNPITEYAGPYQQGRFPLQLAFGGAGSPLQYSGRYYINLQGLIGQEEHGHPSFTQTITIPSKPGSDIRQGLLVQLDESGRDPWIETTNYNPYAASHKLLVSSSEPSGNMITSMDWIFDIQAPHRFQFSSIPGNDYTLSFGSNYWFQTYAADADGEQLGILSEVKKIRTITYSAPIITGLFRWEHGVPSEFQYSLEISRDEGFGDIVTSETVSGTSRPFTGENLQWGTPYFFRVRGIRSITENYGYAANPLSFTLSISGEHSLDHQRSSLDLSWIFSTGTTLTTEVNYYTAEITKNGLVVLSQTCNTPQISLQYSDLDFDVPYMWRIKLHFPDGSSMTSNPLGNFSIPVPPQQVSGLSPNAAELNTLTPTLSWTAVVNAVNYEVSMMWSRDQSIFIPVYQGPNTEFTPQQLSSGTTYQWRIRAVNEHSVYGPASEIASFTTPQLSSDRPVLTLFEPTVEGTCKNIILGWMANTTVAKYRVEVSNGLYGPAEITEAFLLIAYRYLTPGQSYEWSVTPIYSDNSAGDQVSATFSAASPPDFLLAVDGNTSIAVDPKQINTLRVSSHVSECLSIENRQLDYLWTVSPNLNQEVQDMNTAIINIPANAMTQGQLYVFTCTANYHHIAGSSKSVSITVEAQRAALVAQIAGGSAASIGANQDFTLDASGSSDPANAEREMQYSWSVVDANGAAVIDQKTNRSISLPSAAQITIQGGQLAVGAYRFTVTVSKDTRTASATVDRAIVAGNPPQVSIRQIQPRTAIVLPNSHVILQGQVERPGRLTFRWSCIEGGLNLSAVETDRRSLILNQNQDAYFAGGTTYKFKLEVTDAAGRTGTAEIEFTIPTPPSGGMFTVEPSQGPPGTVITLTADAWASDHTPLTYQFFERTGSGLIPLTNRIQTLTHTHTALRPNSSYQLVVRVFDALGQYVEKNVTFTTGAAPPGSQTSLTIEFQLGGNQGGSN